MKRMAINRVAFSIAAFITPALATTLVQAADYEVTVPYGETNTIDAAFVANLGTDNLIKLGRGMLVSSADMASYTGTITIREGAFEITTSNDLGTGDGGTVVEDGGTLFVNMESSNDRFGNEQFTIAGTGDSAYGAAVYQPKSKDEFKLFKYLALSGDATIYAGTRLGVDGGTLTMNGHTLTLTGANHYYRDVTYASPLGNLVVEANLAFVRNQNATADATKTLTVRNGGRIGFAEAYTTPSFWTLVVEDGGKVASSSSSTFTWGGDVVWNSVTEDSVTGLLTFVNDVTGTGTIKSSDGTLTFAKPLGAGLGLGLSGTATAVLKGFSYSHKGMLTGRRTDGWEAGFNTDRSDTQWSYCAYGPGPQLTRDGYWDDSHPNGKARVWCSRGYIWNREATNVTYTIFVGCVYQTYVYIDGTQVYNNKRDSWSNTYSFEVPAGTCKSIDIRTTDGVSVGGPRPEKGDSDKFHINGVIANDPSGYYFTTNAVSVLENTPALTTLSLASDGVIDASGMPMSVSNLVGGAVVTNVTTLTVSNSWTLDAAGIVAGDALVVYGDLAFGADCAFGLTGSSALPTTTSYTVATADSISGLANGKTVTYQGQTWKFALAGDGESIELVYVPQSTAIIMQ